MNLLQVRPADPARIDPHQHLARPNLGNSNRLGANIIDRAVDSGLHCAWNCFRHNLPRLTETIHDFSSASCNREASKTPASSSPPEQSTPSLTIANAIRIADHLLADRLT
jgi:hypothetical protein